jgi:hypothetical protein
VQSVLTSFSLPSSTACLTPSQLNAALHGLALHDASTPIMQATLASLSAHSCRAYWRFGHSRKYFLLYLLPFPSRGLLYHFVTSLQIIACVCSVGHQPPCHAIMLLQHSLRRSSYLRHDFFALTSQLLHKLSLLRRKSLWLPMGRYLVRALCRKLPGGLISGLRFKRNRLSPI